MKRMDAIQSLIKIVRDNCFDDCFILTKEEADKMLLALENIGMRPPSLPEMHCQAIMDVYYGGYSFNQWEEDFEKDEKVMKALQKRLDWKK